MQLARYRTPVLNPWQELQDMRNRLRGLFAEPSKLDMLVSENVGFAPAVEINETDDEILVTAELPGVSREQVEISIENNVLTLRGEKSEEREEKEKETYLYERSYGSFQRTFSLPAPVDEEKVKAELTDGILRIHLPKVERSNGKKITIE